MRTTYYMASLLLMMSMLTFNACNKDEENNSQTEQLATEDSDMDEMANLIDAIVDLKTSDEETGLSAALLKTTTYPTITAVSTGENFWPRLITIDFGSENTTFTLGSGNHGRTLEFRGKIEIEKTGPFNADGSTRTISFDNFYINDNHIEGSQSYSNDGLNSNKNWVFTWQSNLTVTATDNTWIKRQVVKSREMTAGASTLLNIWDDEFTINGTATGSNSKGWSYNNAIANVLIKRICRFPISGTVTITTGNANTFVLDYGNGECDNNASLTDTSGNSIELTLGNRWMSK